MNGCIDEGKYGCFYKWTDVPKNGWKKIDRWMHGINNNIYYLFIFTHIYSDILSSKVTLHIVW